MSLAARTATLKSVLRDALMPRYSLRTLLIVAGLLPALIPARSSMKRASHQGLAMAILLNVDPYWLCAWPGCPDAQAD